MHDRTLVQEESRVLRLRIVDSEESLPRGLQITTPLDIAVQDATSELEQQFLIIVLLLSYRTIGICNSMDSSAIWE